MMGATQEIAKNLSPRQRIAIADGTDEYLSHGTEMVTWIALRDLGLTFRDGSLQLTKLGKQVRAALHHDKQSCDPPGGL